MRAMRRTHWILLGACLLMSCASGAIEPGVAPVRTDGFVLTGCLESAGSCPAFLAESMRYAQTLCREIGSELEMAQTASIWSLDVNHDGVAEYLFEIGENVYCRDAASLFSCGSLGCPRSLVQRVGESDDWRIIGGIYVEPPEVLAVLPSGVLRAGCPDAPDCAEYWFYEWMGDYYAQSYLEVRGHRVEFAESVHGLHALAAATELLAEPTPGAATVGRYDAATEVAIVGTSPDGAYYYVSPCNACESGFVRRESIARP